MLDYETLIELTEPNSVEQIMIKKHQRILMSPMYQLGLLQDNGQIDTFDSWVLNPSDEKIRTWLNNHDLTNVSDTFTNIRRETNV